jgi:PIN domain nuclease of toxin-antitoxin system
VRLLLDTHVLIWWLARDQTLSGEAQAAISDGDALVAVSSVTAWEMSIKHALGKLVMPDDLEAQLEAHDFDQLPITVADALAAGALPRHHEDPFDRMLIAQAQARGLTIVTRNRLFALYRVQTLPA